MAPGPQRLAFTFAILVAMAVCLAITTWAAAPKHAPGSAAPVAAKAANYRAELWKVY
jgi:hypothetical protein